MKLARLPACSLLPSLLYLLCRASRALHCISAAPAALDRYLAALPAMSLVPFAPFPYSYQRDAGFRNSSLQKLQQTILKLRRCPHSVAATSQLCLLSRKSLSSIATRSLPALTRSYPRHFYVDHSHCLVLAPATLAALPSTRAIPDRDVFYVAHPIRSIQAM